MYIGEVIGFVELAIILLVMVCILRRILKLEKLRKEEERLEKIKNKDVSYQVLGFLSVDNKLGLLLEKNDGEIEAISISNLY